ncbi:SDR family oxidoreductase [Streptomonospora nanhaiensis]|uniref:3-oxoacyl-[acyl-carrier protein] reductase n=1 Tax=Streptomonospora nanhaiensis TaxID=1323731 RepID=A0A853BID6_9ACTN|nr:SDR family oxidoreductase [Streptomonospora nanhaiensis]MBV2363154.1 SDR family oxidoreductase [Streptomonospora nanhaiensis]NYI94352.1 3-oxoacyl-[acyl-carrier protein] reductase [Streptomonospora nanhaiensis]
MPATPSAPRPIALVTGAGRTRGIGAAIARDLAAHGFDIAFTHWSAYDARMPWGAQPDAASAITADITAAGARALSLEADLADPDTPHRLITQTTRHLGPVTALVMAHCESVDSAIDTTTPESFDRHMAVNARAAWLLIRAFARAFPGPHGTGRIIALTSDHTAHNLPYGASKGALDRITLAAARELAHLGVCANVVNPGPVDTGWMSPELAERMRAATPLGRLGTPADCANLVTFLCSPQGGWINGQLLHSNGGLAP